MADEAGVSVDAPAAGEAVHLPGPSYLPAIVAAAITGVVVGVVVYWPVTAISLVVLVVALVRWIGDTRRDISDLPLEH